MELDMNVPVFAHLARLLDHRKQYVVAGAQVDMLKCEEGIDYRKQFNAHAWHPFYIQVNRHHALKEYYPRAFKEEGGNGWDQVYIMQLQSDDWHCRALVLKHDGLTETPAGVWFVEEQAARKKLEELLGIFSGESIQSRAIEGITKYVRSLRRTPSGLTLK
jgi:hypothetical protein